MFIHIYISIYYSLQSQYSLTSHHSQPSLASLNKNNNNNIDWNLIYIYMYIYEKSKKGGDTLQMYP